MIVNLFVSYLFLMIVNLFVSYLFSDRYIENILLTQRQFDIRNIASESRVVMTWLEQMQM